MAADTREAWLGGVETGPCGVGGWRGGGWGEGEGEGEGEDEGEDEDDVGAGWIRRWDIVRPDPVEPLIGLRVWKRERMVCVFCFVGRKFGFFSLVRRRNGSTSTTQQRDDVLLDSSFTLCYFCDFSNSSRCIAWGVCVCVRVCVCACDWET